MYELRIVLDSMVITADGIETGSTPQLQQARELWKHIQEQKNVEIRRRERVAELERIKLQLRRDTTEMINRIKSFARLYDTKGVTEEARQNLNQAIQELFDELKHVETEIDKIKKDNDILDFHMDAVKGKVLPEFEKKKTRVELLVEETFENFSVPSTKQLTSHERPQLGPKKPETSEYRETGTPFHYDKAKAKELGMEAVELPAHAKAQELCDKIIANDSAFMKNGKLDKKVIQQFWNTYCHDLPNIPKKSWWYFEKLATGKIADTIDNDSKTTTTKRHIPNFGEPTFLLAMDFPEFDWNDPQQKKQALDHPSMKIIKKLFNKQDPTTITRDEVNTALWSNHDTRTPSQKAQEIIAELLGIKANDPEINNYELRLIRQDEYARMAQEKNYGKKNLWTHKDGYLIRREGGKRDGLIGGSRADGGAAHVGIHWRDSRSDANAVRLVLQRKQ